MAIIRNQQVTLKPQDLVVLFKLIAIGETPVTYATLGNELRISASEIHASIVRARLARLVSGVRGDAVKIARGPLRDFVLHGAQYAFPPISGSLLRGMPTAYAGPGLRDRITLPDEPLPVWPYSKGSARGVALHPLYPSVPSAAEKDPKLYETLSLFDAIRVGAARERALATEALTKILV